MRMSLVDLDGFETRKPSQMSGGQQQRVALARALVNRPKVLLLDEPLGALDLKLRKQMQLELKRIQQEVGITFIYVTHDQEEAMTMSDRLAVMRRGKIEQIGAPEAVYESPATEFVAGFLGASNLLDGELVRNQSDVATVRLSTGETSPSRPRWVPSDIDTLVKVGVRPEKISIAGGRGEPPADRTRSRAAPDRRRTSASAISTRSRGRAGHELTVYVQNLGAEEAPAPGRKVRLTWRPEHTFIVKPSEAALSRGGRGMTDQQQPVDPALWRGLTQARTSRRGFLRAAGVGAGALSLSSILAACGTAGVSGSSAAANGVGSAEWWGQQPETTTLNYANWPYYIDTAHGKHPSIEQFQPVDRDHRRLHRSRSSDNHLVLHEDPSGPAGRQLHRLRRDRAHRTAIRPWAR